MAVMAVMTAVPRPGRAGQAQSAQSEQHGRRQPSVRTEKVSDHEVARVLELQQDVRYRETSRARLSPFRGSYEVRNPRT